MPVYRQVSITYWQDKFVLKLTPEEKFFYIYLLTNSKTKQCGIYELPLQIVQVETGYNRETVIKLLQRFIEHGKIRYDWENEEVFLLNWIKHNPFENNPNVKKCVINELRDVHNVDMIPDESPLKGLARGLQGGSQKEKEEEQEKEEVYSATAQRKSRFEPPKIDAVCEYGLQIGLTRQSSEHFFDHFESNGWRVGGKSPMKNWQSAMRNWKRNETKFGGNGGNPQIGNRKSDQTSRATFHHSDEQLRNREKLKESISALH